MSRTKYPISEDALMRAVFHQVQSRGIARVSMDEVARAVRVSVGRLYAHFGNREALLASAYRTYSFWVDSRLDDRFSEYPEGQPFWPFWRMLVRHFIDDPDGRTFLTLFRERESFLPLSEQSRIVPYTLELWLERNADLLGPAPLGAQALIVWGLLSASASKLVGQRQRGPISTNALGEACWAALRAGRRGWTHPRGALRIFTPPR